MKAIALLAVASMALCIGGCSDLTEPTKFRVVKESAAPAVIQLPATVTATPKPGPTPKPGAKAPPGAALGQRAKRARPAGARRKGG